MRVLWLCVLLLLGGCGDPREQRMRASLEHARQQLHQAQIEPFAANRLRAVLETSATPIDYIEKSVPDGTDLGPFRWERPEQAFDVVISGNVDDWRIDGYGESLEKPLASVNARR